MVMKKLARGAARAIKEWIGRTPDTPAPDGVRLRVWERQKGKCAITARKITTGDKKRLDHKVPVADWTGEPPHGNRESNLQWILDAPHKVKTKAEAAVRKKVRKRAKSHAGIKTPSPRPLQSRNDLPTSAKPKIKKIPPPTHLPTQLERLYGIRDEEAKPRRKP
jgi:5-methylcytosine-specific restriction endonuclease McrA